MTAANNPSLMHAMTHAMQNAMNAAQGSILGQAQMAGYPGEARRIESWFEHNRQTSVQVITADNGFILVFKPMEFGVAPRTLVASTVEEVRDLITSEMVAKKLEK